MRILFVDDEEQVLDGIQRTLFHVDGWDVECALSGQEALEILEDEAFDVVVSDMRMPGMDGAELLGRIHELHPNTVRMVLSGHAEHEAALRTINVAHQFIAKPCKPGALQAAIEKTLELQRLLGSPTVQNLVGRVPTLPSPPSLYTQLTALMANEDVELKQVSELVETDPALCAKLLQVVNSAFFAQSEPTTEVHTAVVKLGMSTLKGLVLSLEALGKFKHANIPGFSLDNERHAASRTARLAVALSPNKTVRSAAFMAATLHDIGKWVLAAEAPETLAEVLSKARQNNCPLHEVETAEYGATHAEVGAYLLGLWCLPEAVVLAVANHHARERLTTDGPLDAARIVYIANAFVEGMPLSDDDLKQLGCGLSRAQVQQQLEATSAAG